MSATSQLLCSALAWLAVNAIWQGIFVALVFLIASRIVRTPSSRVILGHICILLFLLAQMVTIVTLFKEPRSFQVSAAFVARATSDLLPHGEMRRLPLPGGNVQVVLDQAKPFLPWMAMIWVTASAVVVLRIVGALLLLRREVALCKPMEPDRANRFTALAKRLGIKRPVSFVASDRLTVPATAGIRRSAVLLPVDQLLPLTLEQTEAMILHELAHVRRADFATGLVTVFVRAIYCFHPVIRWICGRIDHHGEEAADAIAAEAFGDRKAYATALLVVAEKRLNVPLAMGADGGDLRLRMLSILRTNQPLSRLRSIAVMICTVVGGVVVLGAFGDTVSRSAGERREREFVESRSLGEVVVGTLSRDRENPAFDADFRKAIIEMRFEGRLAQPTINALTNDLLTAVPSNRFYQESLRYLPRIQRTNFGSMGTSSELVSIDNAILGDRSDRDRVRAALVLAAIFEVTDDDVQLRILIRDKAVMGAAAVLPDEFYRMQLAQTAHAERLTRTSKLLELVERGYSPTPAEIRIMSRDLRSYPSGEIVAARTLPASLRRAIATCDDNDTGGLSLAMIRSTLP